MSRFPFVAVLGLAFLPLLAVATPSLDDAIALLRKGEYAGAETLLTELSVRMPRNGLLWFNLGTARFNGENFDGAILAFSRVVALKSPLAPGALLCVAKCHRRGFRWEEARTVLAEAKEAGAPAELVDSETRQLAAAVAAEGSEALERDDAGAALALFDISLALHADSDTVYRRSLALTALGRYDEAREGFVEVVARGSEGRDGSDARYFLHRLDTGRSGSPFWLNVEAGVGYDSNVFLSGASDSPTSAAASLVYMGLGWQRSGKEDFLARVGGSVTWEENHGQSLGRFLTSSLWSHLGYEGREWSVRLAPAVHYGIIGTDPYLLRAGAGLLADHRWGALGAGVELRSLKYFPQSASYSYLDGVVHWGEAHVDYVGSEVEVRGYYALFIENTRDLVSGTTTLPVRDIAHGPGMKLFWFPALDWSVQVSAAYLSRRYRNPAQPGSLRRLDDLASSYVRLSYRIGEGLSLFASASLLVNRSTLGSNSGVSDRNYTQLFTIAGVAWNAIH